MVRVLNLIIINQSIFPIHLPSHLSCATGQISQHWSQHRASPLARQFVRNQIKDVLFL